MKLHFRELGSGPPLVILHGLLGSLDNWLPVAQKLAPHCRIFLLNLRNHGQSPHTEEFGYDEMSSDLREFLYQQQVARSHVLGHSMGGKVAMRFAQTHPELVNQLVVVDIAPREYSRCYDTMMDAMLSVDLSAFQRREEVDLALVPTIPDKSLRQFLLKNLSRDESGRWFWKPNLKVIRAHYDHLRRGLPSSSSCNVPTLFIRGEKSDYIQPNDLGLIQTLFPMARMETISNAGHWVHASAPDQVAEVVTRFLLSEL